MSSSKYYDRYWSDEGLNPRGTLLAPYIVSLLDRWVEDGFSTLDFGCGAGDKVSDWVMSRDISYLGADISSVAVEGAIANGLNAVVVSDGTNMEFGDASFDAVTSFEVLEHLDQPERVCSEFLRILKPGGVLIATVPNTVELRRRLQFAAGTWNPLGDDRSVKEPWRDPHLRFFTAKSFRAMIEEAGFEVHSVAGHTDFSSNPRRPRVHKLEQGRVYQSLVSHFPSLFGVRLNIVARKPFR